ncbi:hypothetical protein A3K34_01205 [candidate division WWE3 bacterium RIFOXYC1_FULL_40_10]|uniref:Uncharacterized protein n=1 Tax=candidate division WWE3 bacterium RIFOXYA2_FULL_46_9 TaxID=1802636 RepID=A0A1F4W214_UNCKA|nr:MAG: hypothetical protein A3K58_01205 [candidate division WWE3 bacterium RIFOXYB1_FULL_40_22]OGC61487.1 MAG: hypothetical protein A3K37_01205 [candidate division WWE3 bacterium RIFOXYA1_FULL_40_11]OGC63457.1 MAG: hypothetical protein A2264_01685 [candidate division WWE3 bacterium RIFOXYA2_FULL_46_9]OGC64580.1 MAG: hypothetical protein A2326_03560 [candidate division WWE3 bacterium RIFOXYB2_FULL_41_6]OGC65870.1 MAG: hypothetical protein A3K34_01205 [candidate division WWE3 bacterium RIFOXYC1_
MPYSEIHKIIKKKLVKGIPSPGNLVTINIDDTFTQDALGTLVWLEVEKMKPKKLRTRTISFIDHNTLQLGFENSDDHDFLKDIAKKYGAILSKAGNGICHQLYLEQFAKPGISVIGSDSHTSMAGGMGCLAIGVGGLDVALTACSGQFTFEYPRIIKINLINKLRKWVSAKDIVLKVIQILGKRNKGWAIEYSGKGCRTLSVPERATICNMGAEMGVTCSFFPADAITYKFLTLVGRPTTKTLNENYETIEFDRTIDIDLSVIEPMIVLNPEKNQKGLGDIVPVAYAKDIAVDQVYIGSCTNSSYHDIKVASECLKNSTVNKSVELVVTPGTRSLLEVLEKEGSIKNLIGKGARITEPACTGCLGQGYSPRSGGVRLSTFNRNFIGRTGTKDALHYISSPETAVASAITGKISDPRVVFKNISFVRHLTKMYESNNALIENNKTAAPNTTVRYGPNILPIPMSTPFPNSFSGQVVIMLGDNITTDDICPAGSWLKYRSNVPYYSKAVFSNIDSTFVDRAEKFKKSNIPGVIVAGTGYGEGSSREHAALCPTYLGIKLVLAKGFQRIMEANLINFGILPLVITNEIFNTLKQGSTVSISKFVEGAKRNKAITLLVDDHTFMINHHLSSDQIELISSGGVLD